MLALGGAYLVIFVAALWIGKMHADLPDDPIPRGD